MINRLKNYLVVLFGISSVEAKGLIIIFIFIFLLLFISLSVPRGCSSRYESYYSDKKILDSIISQIENDSNSPGKAVENSIRKKQPRYFKFNPNTATGPDLDSLGFPSFLSERLIKYRKSGGNFTVKKDVMKLFGMTDEFYHRLEPFIELPESVPGSPARIKPEESHLMVKTIPEKFDLNLADSSRLVLINGIGPVLAARIIRFRSRLGGFTSLEQLNDIYGLRDPALDNLKTAGFISQEFKPAKININFAGWADLIKHPYFDKDLANRVINYRDATGPFHSLDDLRKIKGVNDTTLSKIEKYIDF